MTAVLRQVLCSAILSATWFTTGMIFTWPSTMLTFYGSTNTTLSRPMAKMELALSDSLTSIGALIATPFAGYFLDRIGRKQSTILMALSNILAYTLLITCNRVDVALLSMLVFGFGGCVYVVIPVYVSEICDESIRGSAISVSMAFYYVGMAVSFWLGGILEYYALLYTNLFIAVTSTVLLGILKDSPLSLIQKGLEKEAAASIAFYKGIPQDSKEVCKDLEKIRQTTNFPVEDSPENEEMLKSESEKSTKEVSKWMFIKKSHSTRRAFTVINVIWMLSYCQGLVVVQAYAPLIFEQAVPTMSGTVCSIIFSIVNAVSTLLVAYLVEKTGRKPLMVYSSMAAGLCCLVLATQLQLLWAPPVAAAALLQLYCLMFVIGPGTVPYVVGAEIFMPKVKSMLLMLTMELGWLWTFVVSFIFFPLESAIGLSGVFYVFAASSFLTAIFCAVFLPETKDLSINEIQAAFN